MHDGAVGCTSEAENKEENNAYVVWTHLLYARNLPAFSWQLSEAAIALLSLERGKWNSQRAEASRDRLRFDHEVHVSTALAPCQAYRKSPEQLFGKSKEGDELM